MSCPPLDVFSSCPCGSNHHGSDREGTFKVAAYDMDLEAGGVLFGQVVKATLRHRSFLPVAIPSALILGKAESTEC